MLAKAANAFALVILFNILTAQPVSRLLESLSVACWGIILSLVMQMLCRMARKLSRMKMKAH